MLRQNTASLLARLGAISIAAAAAAAEELVTFEEHVKPILRQHCAACHNEDDAASDFAADSYQRAIDGGAGGEVLSAGDAQGSRLWRLVTHAEEPVMPPGGEKLPAEQLALIRAWIDGGLLNDSGSKPLPTRKPAIASIDPEMLGKPIGEPAMPVGLFRQPLVWGPKPGPIDAIATSPWAPLVAIGWQRQVSLFHAESHRLLGVVPYLEGRPRVVRFSTDGSLLLVAGGREASLGNAAIYDVATGARVAAVGDELDAVLAADLSPDNTLVAIGGSSKKIRVYRVSDGSLAYTLGKHTDWVTALAFSPDGALLATADRSSGLRLWQAAAGYERGDLRGHSAAITGLAWRRDAGVLASSSEDGTARLWKPDGGAIKSITAHTGGVLSVAFAPDGRVATAGRDRLVKLWKSDGAHEADVHRAEDIALAVAVTQDGRRVLAADYTGAVHSIDAVKHHALARLTPNPPRLEQRLELAVADVRVQQQRHDRAIAARDQAIETLEQTRARIEKLKRKIVTAEEARATTLDAARDAEARLAQQKSRLAAAEEALSVAKTLTDLAAASSGEENGASSVVAENAKGACDLLERAVAASKTLMKAATEEAGVARAETDAAEQRLAAVSEQIKTLPDLAELRSVADSQEETLASAGKALESAKRKQAALSTEIEALRGASETLRAAAVAAAEKRAAQDGAISEAKKQLESAVEEKNQAISVAAKLEAEIRELRGQLAERRANISEMEAAEKMASAAVEAQVARQEQHHRAANLAEARLEQWVAAEQFRETHVRQEESTQSPQKKAEKVSAD